MERQIITQGEARSFAFFNVTLTVVGEPNVRISQRDKVEFTIGRRNRKPIIIKQYPGEIEREVNDTFVIHLTAKETAKLPCLAYRMRLTVDRGGHGDEVFTMVDRELEVVAK